jgi:large subunit ribosomal protein L25
MERIKIQVSKREEKGKGPIGRLRKTGVVPAVVYSENMNVLLSISIESLKVLRAIHFSESAILDMNITGGEKIKSIPVLIKDIQFNPITEAVDHIDFLKVSLKEKIKVHVPIVLKGEAAGVKEGECVLTQALREIEVEGLPLDIPEHIDLDISELTIGHSIHAETVKLPDNIIMMTDPQETIVALGLKKEEEEVVVEEEETLEPELIKDKKEGDEEAAAPSEAKEEKKEKKEKKE